jgi:hypothetical protein
MRCEAVRWTHLFAVKMPHFTLPPFGGKTAPPQFRKPHLPNLISTSSYILPFFFFLIFFLIETYGLAYNLKKKKKIKEKRKKKKRKEEDIIITLIGSSAIW